MKTKYRLMLKIELWEDGAVKFVGSEPMPLKELAACGEALQALCEKVTGEKPYIYPSSNVGQDCSHANESEA